MRRILNRCVSTRFSTAAVLHTLDIISRLDMTLGLFATRKANRANSRLVRLAITLPLNLTREDSPQTYRSLPGDLPAGVPPGIVPRSALNKAERSSAFKSSLCCAAGFDPEPAALRPGRAMAAPAGRTKSRVTRPWLDRFKKTDTALLRGAVAAVVPFIAVHLVAALRGRPLPGRRFNHTNENCPPGT